MALKSSMNFGSWRFLVLMTLCLGAFLGLIAFSVGSRNRQQQKEVPSKDRLRWHAKEAKKEGRQTVVIPTPIIEYVGSKNRGLDHILDEYTIVTAQVVATRTVQADDNNLITWYKFVITDSLTPIRTPACLSCLTLTPPSDMPIDYSREFLVPKAGGTLMVDGVTVVQREGGFPELQQNQSYLLFLAMYPNRVGLIMGGPRGAFTIDKDLKIGAIFKEPDQVQDQLKSKFDNSVGELKRHLQKNRK